MRPTFTNPLYPASLPDPYVLKVHGQYWAYGSERSTDGRYFKILHSPDLLHWQEIGGALDEQPGGHPCYWAPEVVEWDSTFYLYYSLGNETLMSIHVASAASPAGPFVDRGRSLTQEPFAIDAHVFTDEDGERYLFYATDFYDHARIGTGTICDRMLDPFTLAGSPHPVSRARYVGQIFDPQRKEKGGVRWHTLEGPFVLKHKGRYYQMFSGGNWQNTTYGVSYATSLSLEDPEEWQQACDGLDTLPILRSLPEKGVVGPGHNSVVRAPDNRQWFCVYHRWAPTANGPQRVMAADRLEFIGDRLVVYGPSSTPQPAPLPPTRAFFTPSPGYTAGLPAPWQTLSGAWQQEQGAAVQTGFSAQAEAAWDLPASSFLLELGIRPAQTEPGASPACGLRLDVGDIAVFNVSYQPDERCLRIETTQGVSDLSLSAPWLPGMERLLRLELDHRCIALSLPGTAMHWQGNLTVSPSRLVLWTHKMNASFSTFEWTAGWEQRFDLPACDLASLGWAQTPAGAWSIKECLLSATPVLSGASLLSKSLPLGDLEIVLNACLDCQADPIWGYAFGPLSALDGLPCFRLVRSPAGWALAGSSPEEPVLLLPASFDPAISQQFRLSLQAGQCSIAWQDQPLGSLSMLPLDGRFGLCVWQSRAWFDLLRVTALPGNQIGETYAPA